MTPDDAVSHGRWVRAMEAPFPVARPLPGCHPHLVPNEWIEQALKPKLATVPLRRWSGGEPRRFMIEVREEIFAAARSGALSDDDQSEALRLLMAAVASIPGVGSFTMTAERLDQ